MTDRLAIVVSHPIQHFAPWHREVAKIKDLELLVFFCCDWGSETYFDPEFGSEVRWDVPLLEGYGYEFLHLPERPNRLNYWQVDNPGIGKSLDRFNPDVVKVFGYTYKTNWRTARWARQMGKPLLLYSDSNVRAETSFWKRIAKETIVSRFYSKVDGALFVGDNNFEYHRRYGIPQERLFRGSLPIDQSQLLSAVPDRAFARNEIRTNHGIPHEAFVVMFCGKYAARKRPLDVIAAAHLAAGKGIPVWALMVGEGPERTKLEAHCRDHGVTNVVLTGLVNQSQVPKYYAASDAIVVSSEQDPHPLVITEAATFGLPAIVSDKVGCIGPSDTARPEVTALVYPCGDYRALAKRIECLYHEPVRYAQLSSSAVEIAKTQDVKAAARDLVAAAHQLAELGPR